MTTDLVKGYIEKIGKAAQGQDFETAHALEDQLYHLFIHDICEGDYGTIEEVVKIARHINRTIYLPFPRQCS